MKAKLSLDEQSVPQLFAKIKELRKTLAKQRQDLLLGKIKDTSVFHRTRRQIARALTYVSVKINQEIK